MGSQPLSALTQLNISGQSLFNIPLQAPTPADVGKVYGPVIVSNNQAFVPLIDQSLLPPPNYDPWPAIWSNGHVLTKINGQVGAASPSSLLLNNILVSDSQTFSSQYITTNYSTTTAMNTAITTAVNNVRQIPSATNQPDGYVPMVSSGAWVPSQLPGVINGLVSQEQEHNLDLSTFVWNQLGFSSVATPPTLGTGFLKVRRKRIQNLVHLNGTLYFQGSAGSLIQSLAIPLASNGLPTAYDDFAVNGLSPSVNTSGPYPGLELASGSCQIYIGSSSATSFTQLTKNTNLQFCVLLKVVGSSLPLNGQQVIYIVNHTSTTGNQGMRACRFSISYQVA